MIVWDVTTGLVIERIDDIEVPKNWYTTVAGWEQHKEEVAVAQKIWDKYDRQLLFGTEFELE